MWTQSREGNLGLGDLCDWLVYMFVNCSHLSRVGVLLVSTGFGCTGQLCLPGFQALCMYADMHMWLPAFRLPIRIRKSSPTWHELVYLCLFRLVSSWDSWFWLSDCLFVWLIDCLIGWFITWLITCMIVRVSKWFYTSMHVYLYGTHHVHSHPYRVGADSNEDLDPGVTSVRHCEMAGKNKVLFAGTMVCTAIYVPRGLWTLMSLGIESWLSYHVAGNTRVFFFSEQRFR